jgi:thiol:disulfide interchange protein
MNKHRIGALVAAAALTLTFAGTAFASTFEWTGQGFPNEKCTEDSTVMQWVWTGDNPTSLTINGNLQSGTWEQKGGGAFQFQATIDQDNYPPLTASVEYTGDAGTLTLSGCDEHTTTTTEETTTEETTTEETTTEETTTEETTTEETTSEETTSEETTSEETTSEETTSSASVEELTPPSTDTIGQPTSSSSVSTGLLLVLAGILAAVLVVVPAAARNRR